MKKLLFLFLIMGLLPSCVSTHKPALKSDKAVGLDGFKKRVNEIIVRSDPNVNIGIQISSLKDGSVVFEKNAHRHFVPASTIKVITLAAALYYLGPSYRFETEIFAEGLNEDGSKVQNLFLKGSGDPSLMDHDLLTLASEVKQMGISQITGNIFVDAGIFDDVLWSEGTATEDRALGFGAPNCGINLNSNRLVIKTMPAPLKSGLSYVVVKPDTKYIKIKTNMMTKNIKSRPLSFSIEHSDGTKEAWPNAMSEGLQRGDTVHINGRLQKGSDPQYAMLSVKDPAMMAGVVFKEHLKRLGVRVKGQVLRQAVPLKALKMTSLFSRSLGELMVDATKYSNNVANNSLIKAISAKHGQRPATSQGGLKLINDFLAKEVGISPGSLIAADGAGLSRYNLVTPHQMVKVLTYAATRFNMAPEFMVALPIGGQDGTLISRLKGDMFKGNIRAKTGYMSGLSNLVGYLSADNGERYAFAFMVNGFVGSAEKYRKMQEDVLASMFSESNTALAASE